MSHPWVGLQTALAVQISAPICLSGRDALPQLPLQLSHLLIYIEVRKQVADAPQVRSATYSKRKLLLRVYTKAR